MSPPGTVPDIYDPARIHRRNVEFFRRLNPGYTVSPEPMPGIDALIVRDPLTGEPTNIRSAEGLFYPEHAKAAAWRQVDDFLASPRLKAPIQLIPPDDEILFAVGETIDGAMDRPLVAEPSPYVFPGDYGPTVVVFGTGLGYHIQRLLELVDVHHLLVYEPSETLFALSLATFDWTALSDRLLQPGRTFGVVNNLPGNRGGEALLGLLRQVAQSHLHGARPLVHYNSPDVTEAAAVIQRAMPILLTPRGYYKDQRRQILHTSRNVAKATGWIAKKWPVAPNTDLIVVGSGPSLNESIELIREIRERCVVMTCGSAIRPVLRGGIRPDFHLELETAPEAMAFFRSLDDPSVLGSISLVGSAGVFPEMLDLFAEAFLYPRIGVTCTSMLTHAAEPLNFSDPTVGNSGVALGLALGFSRVTLVGIDLGFRDVKRHHASNTVYVDDETGETRTDFKHIGLEMPMMGFDDKTGYHQTIAVTGETITTNDLFLYGIRSLEKLISTSPNAGTVLQCGNGARIDGAVNLTVDQVDRSIYRGKRADALAMVRQRLETPPTLISGYQAAFGTTLSQLREISGILRTLMAPAPRTRSELLIASQRMTQLLLGPMLVQAPGVVELIGGTLFSFFQVAVQRSLMVTNGGELDRFLSAVDHAFHHAMDLMVEGIEGISVA